jgi:hypothetical protein
VATTAYVDAIAALKANLSSPTFTGTPAASTASPGTNTTQLATTAFTKAAVDAALNGLSWKQAVRAASTANGTLASAFENGDTLDGVTLATGDRILLKNQSTGAENGIYTVNARGADARRRRRRGLRAGQRHDVRLRRHGQRRHGVDLYQ